jgi:hypothetical protein
MDTGAPEETTLIVTVVGPTSVFKARTKKTCLVAWEVQFNENVP